MPVCHFCGGDSSRTWQLRALRLILQKYRADSVCRCRQIHDHEIATSVFPSGGGFSNTFARPSYQNRAVSSYLNNYPPPYGPDVFNRSGRAYPDVAANGWPIPTVVGGKFNLTGGTSASAPIFASLIVAVNDARLAAGKSPVGWINPAVRASDSSQARTHRLTSIAENQLYSHAFSDAFNDVTSGNNVACDLGGFSAAQGWDPVTGLGTPNFERLLDRFMALP